MTLFPSSLVLGVLRDIRAGGAGMWTASRSSRSPGGQS